MFGLVRRGLVDQSGYDLFNNLRKARNTAAHVKGRITPGEALDYREQAQRLKPFLVAALEKLRGE